MDENVGAGAALPELSLDEAGTVSPLILAVDEAVEAQRLLEQQLRAEFGVNNTDFRALLLVSRYQRQGRAPRPGDLTRELGTTTGAGAQIIRRLTDAGLLTRASHPHDGRAAALTLTPDAAHRLAGATSSVRRELDDILATLDPREEQRLLELLARVRDAFHKQQHARRPGT